MCGINGIFGLADKSTAGAKVNAMNNSLAHRGPDDAGVYSDDFVCLGHRRLSIIDLSSAGKQPMISADGRYVIVYNGELYNYLQLKQKLSDYNYKTNADTEVLIAAYAKWGRGCLQYFEGMFAFAIWDNQTHELFIARDRLGIKPLYYHINNDNVVSFSSELRSLLASKNVSKKINHSALSDYFKYQTVHAPETIIRDVKMLMPGHYMLVTKEKQSIAEYWDLQKNFNVDIKNKSYDAVCNDINSLLIKAVEKRLVSDVPFGAFLSGGIDSSAVVGIMSKIMDKKPDTFSVVFDEQDYSEAHYAQMVANKFNTNHHEIKLKVSHFVEELPSALNAMDFPGGDGPNTYIVSKATKQAGITMALSGLGGDELFAGYDVFKRLTKLYNYRFLASLPLSLKRMATSLLSSKMETSVKNRLLQLMQQPKFDVESIYHLTRLSMTEAEAATLLKIPNPPKNYFPQTIFKQDTALTNNEFLLSKISYAEINTYLQNVLLRDTDQMSMANALEVRVPFLDHHLVEYVFSVPDKYKYPHTPKKLLIDSLDGLLPNEIVNRPKMGFTLPWDKWLKNELLSFCENNFKSLSERNFINAEVVMNLWKSFLRNDSSVKWSRIWYLVVLEDWLKRNDIE